MFNNFRNGFKQDGVYFILVLPLMAIIFATVVYFLIAAAKAGYKTEILVILMSAFVVSAWTSS